MWQSGRIRESLAFYSDSMVDILLEVVEARLKCSVPSIWNIEIALVDVVLSFRSSNEISPRAILIFVFQVRLLSKRTYEAKYFAKLQKGNFFPRSTFTVTRGNEYPSSNCIVERTLFARSIIHVKLINTIFSFFFNDISQ